MINIQTSLDKSGVYQGQKETQLLIELSGQKKKNAQKKQKLNLSFVIDVSGSMGGTVKVQQTFRNIDPIVQPMWPNKLPHQPFAPQWNPNEPWLGVNAPQAMVNQYLNQPIQQVQHVCTSKLDQAKSAAKKAITQMSDGDFASIVIFDDKVSVVHESIELNSASRMSLLNAIERIALGGSTNLHGGWLHGATEVAKKMSGQYINRVIVLTDGQANAGICSPDVIAKDVSGLYEKSISTTTFGIGEGFNEDLLQKMANAGGGNFYYIDDDSKLNKMFEDEFNGLSNICATEVKLSFELKNNTELLENLNDYEQKAGIYLVPNIQANNKLSTLFKLKIKVGKVKNINLGTLVVTYKDTDGLEQKTTMDIKCPVVSKDEWDKLANNEELKVQETLLVIAKNKIAATQAIDRGNFEGAKDLLTQSVMYASASGLSDARLMAESNTLDSTLLKASSANAGDLRKDLSYQSYQTRYNKK